MNSDKKSLSIPKLDLSPTNANLEQSLIEIPNLKKTDG